MIMNRGLDIIEKNKTVFAGHERMGKQETGNQSDVEAARALLQAKVGQKKIM